MANTIAPGTMYSLWNQLFDAANCIALRGWLQILQWFVQSMRTKASFWVYRLREYELTKIVSITEFPQVHLIEVLNILWVHACMLIFKAIHT